MKIKPNKYEGTPRRNSNYDDTFDFEFITGLCTDLIAIGCGKGPELIECYNNCNNWKIVIH